MYRNGTIWRKRYSLVKEAYGCFMLFEFLPVVLKSGSFKPSGRLSAKSKRLLRLRAFAGPLLRIGFDFFFSMIGRYSSVNTGDRGGGRCYAILFLSRWSYAVQRVGRCSSGWYGNAYVSLCLWF